MKAFLILLMLATVALADPVGQGPCPQVTSERIPQFIVSAIENRLNDPDSLVLVDWTQPELRTTRSGGEVIGWWQMNVTIRAKNSYGGVITKNYIVTVDSYGTSATPTR